MVGPKEYRWDEGRFPIATLIRQEPASLTILLVAYYLLIV